ncbi:hypothetical protein MLE19_01090 [Halomonas neptunia]|uniref:Uncharacterized protein n=1 Tax=Vreelandella neptunia TaxID=115551 RepID=A0ABS9S1L2_9GAMM|nr:hypothetical protein [Halomonas neptunia]MCH4809914.1 hypothetical protein [Halomonas neptunia]
MILATATHRILAERVAEHLGCFDKVLSKDNGSIYPRTEKRELLVERFGERGYEYVGNSTDDCEVWRYANAAVMINPERGVERRARKEANVTEMCLSIK